MDEYHRQRPTGNPGYTRSDCSAIPHPPALASSRRSRKKELALFCKLPKSLPGI